MSAWATRCKACGTSFRVTEEQLAISDGYVRCGRCDAVFNARATLFDLEAPASAPMPLQAPAPAPVEAPPVAAPEPPPPRSLADQPAVDAEPRRDAAPAPAVPEPEPALPPEPLADPRAEEPGAHREPVWQPAMEPAPEAAASNRQEPDAARMLELLGAGSSDASAASAPAATWSSLRSRPAPQPTARWLWALSGVGLAALCLALPAHWAWIQRDALRAQHPALDAWMQQHLPQVPRAGWRHLEGLAVASSSLRATPQGGAYQLELVVQNRSAHTLAMPWLDLSLSDAKGQPLLRKALDPGQFQVQAPLAPNEQRRVQAVFTLQGASGVAGYEIGLFHP